MTVDTDALSQPFAKELLRVHPDKKLTYVPISEVVARLNKVLGVGKWGYEVVRVWEAGEQTSDTGSYPVWVMAHVRLTLVAADEVKDRTSAVDGVGGQSVKMLKSGKGPLDLGDEYKGAVSDALKKAAQHLGIGLELARKDEALAWEAAHDAPQRCPREDCGAEVAPGREAMREHFVDAHGYVRTSDGKVAPPPAASAASPEAAVRSEEAGPGRASDSAGEGGGATAPDVVPATRPQITRIMARFGNTDRAVRLTRISEIVGRTVTSSNELTKAEAATVITEMGDA